MIRLSIKCHSASDNSAALKEMGIDTPAETEYRVLNLREDHVSGYYPNVDGGCFIFLGDIEITVKESFEYLEKHIK